MPERAKLFQRGMSQAVRLPENYRFEGQDEVLIYRSGNKVILEPERREWSKSFLEVAGSAPDFPHPKEPAQR